ncbi:MAG TPA: hypothetical protein VIM05_03210 [Gaiellaceae bacterium]|jgi:hypothetical protein
MPTVRDGRGVLTVHDMGVPVASSPSGPVERGTRRQTIPDPPPTVIEPVPQAYVAEQQRRDAAWAKAEGKAKPADTFRRPTLATTLRDQAAASRARGAAAAGFVKGAKKPHQVKAEPPPAEAKPKGAPKGFKRSPEVRERMRQAQVDRYARARGEVPAEVVAEPAHIVTTESQGREASVPATGADERGPTGDPEPAAQVATPLGPPDLTPRRLDEYGPTSALSEDLLLRGYGLLPPARHEEGAR